MYCCRLLSFIADVFYHMVSGCMTAQVTFGFLRANSRDAILGCYHAHVITPLLLIDTDQVAHEQNYQDSIENPTIHTPLPVAEASYKF